MDPTTLFANAATDFCTFAEESPALNPDAEVLRCRSHLAALYHFALGLPDVFGERDAPDLTNADWRRVYDRFASLPFNYYHVSLNPPLLNEEPSIGDVADDLADIWRDLKGGLLLYRDGVIDAATWHWRHTFQFHWGLHAASALHALHVWKPPETPSG